MITSACNTMKKSVTLAGVLLATGILFEIIAQFLSLETMLPVLFTYAGVFTIFLGLSIILLTIIAIMIPKVNRHLDTCQH